MLRGTMRIRASRWRIVLLTLAVVVLLDIGRSFYARIGYARPAEVWRPDQAVYADLTWPPGAALPASTPLGQRIYAQRCAVCHGPDGRGNGPAAPSLIPRPRDFTRGQFKYKSTPAGAPPSDADLVAVVANGLHASAMPYWRDLLSPDDIRAVVAYLKTMSPALPASAPAPLAIPPRVTADDASRARGERLYAAQGCAGCHGADGRLRATLQDAKGYPVIARDLTAPWTFRGGSAPEQVWLRLTTGLAPSPMPAFANTMTPEERWDVVNYVLSLARVPPWEAGGRIDGPGQTTDPVKRGEYLVRAEMCGLCHTQIDRTGIYRGDDYYLAGGMRVGAYPHGVFVSRNLTSDPETGLGRWSEAAIAETIRTGHAPDRTLNFWAMPWIFLHQLSDADALAIARYLKTLPPVHNRIPPALHYGIIETIVMKLTRPLPAMSPVVLTYADGNFAQPDAGFPRALPQQVLVAGQWITLVAGTVAVVLAAPRGRRLPRRRRSWVIGTGWVLGLLSCGLLGATVNAFPALGIIPPEQFANAATANIPEPDYARLGSPEQVALVQRGRYVYTVASCAFCHGGTGGGGNKLSWAAFGSLWTRNISSDPRFGLGRWSDDEVIRAIRSGVTPDGRMLHWQGMIWDHASNWDEEDLRALVAYLRTLPPVAKEVPAAQPPAPDDCPVYSFWIAERRSRGCE
jgi:mono/diheme cytochrome c family protein